MGGGLGCRAVAQEVVGQPESVAPHRGGDRRATEQLLEDSALSEVEKSERAYVDSIGRLSRLAEPRLSQSDSPLFVSYREKITLLDSAIGDLRAQVEQNRYNTHLRRELLAVYREKQLTLEQVVREAKS